MCAGYIPWGPVGVNTHLLARKEGGQAMDYGEVDKMRAWKKAEAIPGKNPNLFRLDRSGAMMRYPEYGKMTPHGWMIVPNLRPMHWATASLTALKKLI